MHDRQYRDYKSGVAKKRFQDELERVKDASMMKNGYSEEEIKKLKQEEGESQCNDRLSDDLDPQ